MEILRELAGYTWGRSDLVRRAMSKKHMEEILAEEQNFIYGNKEEYEKRKDSAEPICYIPGCVANGIPVEAAKTIFDKMLIFANYAFNKCSTRSTLKFTKGWHS